MNDYIFKNLYGEKPHRDKTKWNRDAGLKLQYFIDFGRKPCYTFLVNMYEKASAFQENPLLPAGDFSFTVSIHHPSSCLPVLSL